MCDHAGDAAFAVVTLLCRKKHELIFLVTLIIFASCCAGCDQVLRDAVLWQAPPSKKSGGGAQGKIYYCNQVFLY